MTDGGIAELERRIADLRARLPKHSPPPRMLMELEELEEALEAARRRRRVEEGQTP
jgi:hypothetical protein